MAVVRECDRCGKQVSKEPLTEVRMKEHRQYIMEINAVVNENYELTRDTEPPAQWVFEVCLDCRGVILNQ
jgi:hypothetical protein